MELSPKLYQMFVRPKWYNNRYVNIRLKNLFSDFNFDNKKILDFGCGVGSNSSLFDKENYEGIDYDSRRVNYAKLIYPDYKFSNFDGNNLNFSSKSFDYILIIAVLHHISPDLTDKYLKEFSRILKPNGEILVIEPCKFENSSFNNWFMSTFDKGKYISEEKQYIKLFNDNNYEVKVFNRFKKCHIYNELFFSAKLKG